MFGRSRRYLSRWLMLSMGTVLVAFGGLIYVTEIGRELKALDQQLGNKAKLLVSGVAYSPQADGRHAQLQLKTSPLLGNSTINIDSDIVYVRWYDANNHLLLFAGTLSSDLIIVPGYQTLKSANGQRLRQVTLPIQADEQNLGHLQLAMDLAPAEEALRQALLFLSLGLPVGVGLMGLVGWWFAGQVMRPIQGSYQLMEQFSADASHELRSPIASILGQAELGLITASPQDQQTRLRRIAELAQSMGDLVNSLLLLMSGNQGRALEACNVTALVHQLAHEFRPQAVAKGLQWQLEVPLQDIWVNGELALLHQAIANLLSNACRYTLSGGQVTLRLEQQRSQVKITVKDSGVGISAADLPFIFDRFYRVDRARRQETGGFGLGLAIAQKIISAHSGSIQSESLEDQGSTFTICLPLCKEKDREKSQGKKPGKKTALAQR